MAGRRSNGEGSVTQRKDGRWEAKLSLPNGKRISRYGATKLEARQKLKEAQKHIDDGLDLSAPNVTVAAYLGTWLSASVKPSVKTKTYEGYESIVRVRLVPSIGAIRLTKLTPVRIQQLYADLAEGDDDVAERNDGLPQGDADQPEENKGLSNRSIHHTHRVLHQAMRQAVRWNMLARNPCDGVTPPRPEHHEMNVWSSDEVNAFLAATAAHAMHALYVVALTTGMRQGELLGLKWADVDFDTGKLYVRRSIQRQRGKGIAFIQPKTARSRRPIKLGQRAMNALRAHRLAQVEHRLSMGNAWQDHDLVFATELGAPHDPSWQNKVFKQAVKKAKLREIRFHDMRHTAATLLLSKNVHPKVVSEMLGHASITITLNTYSHFVPSLHDQAADVMDALLSA